MQITPNPTPFRGFDGHIPTMQVDSDPHTMNHDMSLIIRRLTTYSDNTGHVEKIHVHAVVQEDGEFLGDFSVEYTETRDGQYSNTDYEGFRHMGGEYWNKKPASWAMNMAASKVSKGLPHDVSQHWR